MLTLQEFLNTQPQNKKYLLDMLEVMLLNRGHKYTKLWHIHILCALQLLTDLTCIIGASLSEPHSI